MHTITSTIEQLSEEDFDSLQATVSEVNSRLPESSTPFTPETFLADQNLAYIKGRSSHYYNVALNRIGDGFKDKSYTERKALIESLESQI